MDELSGRLIDKVGLALLRDRHLLVARSHGSVVFQIPGGKVEPQDANAVAALCREIREELGLAVNAGSATLIGRYKAAAAGRAGWTVSVRLYAAETSGSPEPCGEIAELHWLSLRHPVSVPVSEVLRDGIIPDLARGQMAR